MFSGTNAGPLHSQLATMTLTLSTPRLASQGREIQACIGRLGIA